MSREVFRLRAFRGKAKKSRDFTRGEGASRLADRAMQSALSGDFSRLATHRTLRPPFPKKRAKMKNLVQIFSGVGGKLRRSFGQQARGTNRSSASQTDVLLVVCVIAGTTAKVAAPTVLSARRDGRERGVRACAGSAERAAPVSVPAPPHGMDVRPGLGPERPDPRASVGIGRHATRAVAGRRPRVPVVPARARARLDRDPHPRHPSRRLDVRAPAPRLVGLLRRRRGRAEPKPKRIHG